MSKIVHIGKLKVGGHNPVRIKGMLKTPARKLSRLIREGLGLELRGAEAIRIAFKEQSETRALRALKKELSVPLVADIHFHPALALAALDAGVDGIRLNPLNITKKDTLKEIVRQAKQRKVSIRIGVNSGGFKEHTSSDGRFARAMVKKVSDYIKLFEDQQFSDIMVSLKASQVSTTIAANRLFSQKFQYPLHLGVTASGPFLQGVIKSSLGIGILLSEGIGSIIRVSLTGASCDEIDVAKAILQFLGLRWFFPEIISCPTCGRCEVNLTRIVDDFQKQLRKVSLPGAFKKVALMGCVVNGPGEAAQADIGVAFGKNKGAIFRRGKVIGYTDPDNTIKDVIRKIRDAV
ncbi:MAG: flavodoxin-dependent (E)-4-hydroxy-3-methylbut-2-enyl-diphosphate synthase [Candidatus Omnitrophica bacterium]|nr:flavodoxin-dependent (E)-4-hydroxy-3-methylbut-2-enyl-diphosphate synthase [Candidatus Omnitrophota bacterium]